MVRLATQTSDEQVRVRWRFRLGFRTRVRFRQISDWNAPFPERKRLSISNAEHFTSNLIAVQFYNSRGRVLGQRFDLGCNGYPSWLLVLRLQLVQRLCIFVFVVYACASVLFSALYTIHAIPWHS